MKFVDMNKEIKSNILNIYNIKGEDQYLIKQAIKNIKSIIVEDLEEFNFIRLDAEKMKTEELSLQISALPIASNYRMVVLDNPNAELVKYLNSFDFTDNPNVIVAVNADKINAEIVDCSSLDRRDITKYILNYCAKNDLKIEEKAVDFFIDACDMQMSRIVNELNKVAACAIDDKIISIDIISNLVSSSQDYAIYMMTNALDNKDYETYQRIISKMSKNLSMGELFSSMGKYFKRMQYISLNKNDEELSKILNIKPYAVKMSRQAIAKNGIKYYLGLYEKYVDLDYKIKSGKISPKNAIYELIF